MAEETIYCVVTVVVATDIIKGVLLALLHDDYRVSSESDADCSCAFCILDVQPHACFDCVYQAWSPGTPKTLPIPLIPRVMCMTEPCTSSAGAATETPCVLWVDAGSACAVFTCVSMGK